MNTGDITAEYSRGLGLCASSRRRQSRNLKINPKVRTEKLHKALKAAGFKTPSRYILMRTITQKYVFRASATNIGASTAHQDAPGMMSSKRKTTNTNVTRTAISQIQTSRIVTPSHIVSSQSVKNILEKVK